MPALTTDASPNALPDILLMFQTRIKFYTQEIVFFRQDLLYRMRKSCLMPPSTEETSDPFEHVSVFILILNGSWLLWLMKAHWDKWFVIFVAACCYHNTSKPSVSPPIECATYYLELWSLSPPLSNSTHSNYFLLFRLLLWTIQTTPPI